MSMTTTCIKSDECWQLDVNAMGRILYHPMSYLGQGERVVLCHGLLFPNNFCVNRLNCCLKIADKKYVISNFPRITNSVRK